MLSIPTCCGGSWGGVLAPVLLFSSVSSVKLVMVIRSVLIPESLEAFRCFLSVLVVLCSA